MPLIRLFMPRWLRRTLYAVLACSWVSGTTVFILSRFVEVEGEFGPMKHPWQAPMLAAHGAFAFLMLIALGALWTNHVPPAWRSRRSRRLGISMLVVTACMAISGWILYYAASEAARPWIGNLHFALGFSLPLILGCHIFSGRRSRPAAIIARQPRSAPQPREQQTS